MFTIRFIRHDTSYKNFSVVSYDVRRDELAAECEMARKLHVMDSVSAFVGPDEEYRVGYVTNIDGKTIDVIKPLEAKHERTN